MTIASNRVLGLDLGTNSLGWALIETDDGGVPNRILDAGVRIFPEVTNGSSAAGRDEPKNLDRRQKRLMRRQILRRQRRRRAIMRHLQAGGLLPIDVPPKSAEIDRFIRELDVRLAAAAAIPAERRSLLPYLLRQQALDRDLAGEELARVLYHLGQRRGFRSNRKDVPKPDEQPGEVKAGIDSLDAAIAEAGARTIGEWFASIDPREVPLRRRWTSRVMYEAEFDLIRARQSPAHPSLSPSWWDRIKKTLFAQRPLRSQSGLVGRCSLEPDRRRTALALPLAQRFRILQTVNHMRIVEDTESRPLDPEQRAALLAALESSENLTIAQARKAVGLGRSDALLSVQLGDEKKLPGNRTMVGIGKAVGPAWASMSEDDRQRLLNDLLSFEDEPALVARVQRAYGLPAAVAEATAKVRLEPGYARHSDRALRRLVPLMEKGHSYAEAKKAAYPESFRGGDAIDSLPPLRASQKLRRPAAPGMEDLRNPVVERSLTELRKVVNALIRAYGKPERIHIELARDLKNPRKVRQAITKAMRKRGDERDVAADALRRLGCTPNRDLIERLLLAHECSDIEDLAKLAWESTFRCPYTGRQFSMRDLIDGRVDIEHIIPFSRSLDDSFANKTLCDPEFNRRRKGNRTPFECLSSSPDEYAQVLERVRHFRGESRSKKLRLFSISEIDENFAQRQLQDTRYASRLASDYLRLLYGPEGASRVVTLGGSVTAHLRRQWGLNGILSGTSEKDRSDHRHHAIDAVVIASCTRSVIKRMSDAAARAEMTGGRDLLLDFKPPWPELAGAVKERMNSVVVSHRADRTVNGDLHKETNYGPPSRRREVGSEGPHGHERKAVKGLTAREIDRIVDPAVRAAVVAWIQAHGALSKIDPAKPDQFPFMLAKDGRRIPIKRVRIRASVSTVAIGQGDRTRYVVPNSNHHMAVFEVPGKGAASVAWVGRICTRLEAMKRWAARQSVVDRTPPPGGRFLFSLSNGDSIFIPSGPDGPCLAVVKSVLPTSTGGAQVKYQAAYDGRPRRDGLDPRRVCSLSSLMRAGAIRVTVSPTGQWTPERA